MGGGGDLLAGQCQMPTSMSTCIHTQEGVWGVGVTQKLENIYFFKTRIKQMGKYI